MGQLTNQFVSQSYQGLLNLENANTGVTATLQYVTDGVGNRLPMQASTSSIVISGSFYGDGSGLTGLTIDSGSLVTTSSFNSYTSSVDIRFDGIEAKTGSYATTGSNIFEGNQTINGDVDITGSLTASGLIYPLADNGAKSFIQTDGAGNLSLQYVDAMYEAVRNGELTQITIGTPLFVSGSQGNSSIVYRADASNPSRMPATYVATEDINPNNNGKAIILGLITGVDTNLYPAGTEVFVGSGGGWTATRPTGSAIVQSLGIVTKQGPGGSGRGVVLNPGPANLRNLPTDNVWLGDSNSYPQATPLSSLGLATTGSLSGYTTVTDFNNYTSSNDTKVNDLISKTGSYVTETESGSFVTNVSQNPFVFNQLVVTKGNGSSTTLTINNVTSASFANNATSASFAQNALSASWAPDNSNRNGLITTGSIGGNQSITGSLDVEGTISATSASFTYVNTIYETASVIYSSGSNQFGDASDDAQTLYGTVILPNLNDYSGSTSNKFVTWNEIPQRLEFTDTITSSSHSEYADDAGLLNGTGSGVFATTGSNTFLGNQTITGSFFLSGSADYDMDIYGRVKISGPSSGNTPRLFVSASNGNTIINNFGYQISNAGFAAVLAQNVNFGGFMASSKADGTEIGFGVDGSQLTNNWTKGPAVYVNNDPSDSYGGVFGFQDKTNYTDGRITLLKNTDISGSLRVTGGITGSLEGTASFATDALSASFAPMPDVSYFATTGSNTFTGQQNIETNLNVTQSLNVGGISTFDGQTTYNDTIQYNADSFIKSGSQINFNIGDGLDGKYYRLSRKVGGEFGIVEDPGNFHLLDISSSFANFLPKTSFQNGVDITGSLNVSGSTHKIIGNTNMTGALLQSSSLPNEFTRVQIANSNKAFFGEANTLLSLVGDTQGIFDFYADGGNYDTLNITVDQNAGTTFRDWQGSTYSNWLKIPTNTGANPAPQFQRGLDVTGSLDVRSGSIYSLSNNTTLNIDNYLTSSIGGQSNIIKGWGDNPAQGGPGANINNYTGSLSITGSNNIVSMPQIRATGLGGSADMQGYISGSDNTIASNNSGIFLNTGSLLFPKTSNNYVGGLSSIRMTFTTSSLAGGHPLIQNNTLYAGTLVLNSNSGSVQAVVGNLFNGGNITSTQNFVTNTRPTIATNLLNSAAVTLNHISSSINFSNNITNSPVTVNNHLSSSITNNSLTLSNNTFLGGSTNTGHLIYVSGSQGTNVTRNIIDNLIGGKNNVVSSSFVGSSNSNLVSTIMYGNALAVSGSHTAGTNGGSAFFGRFNDTGSGLHLSQDIVFAVGTGTAAASRRTGFYITSGSLVGVSGSLDVKGNQTITGSVNISNVMNLQPLDPLPAGNIGDLAVSSSNQLYFYNGAWTLVV